MHFINANHLFATNTSSHASQNMTLHMRWNKSVIQAIFPYCKEFTSSIYKSAFFRVKRHESIYKGHAMSPPCVLLVQHSPHNTTPLLARGISSTFNRYRKNMPLYHPPCFPHKSWVCLQFLCKML